MEQQHTVRSFDEELNNLRSMLMAMGGKVERQFTLAMDALQKRDTDAVPAIIAADKDIDAQDEEIERIAIAMIARRAPMADDLRTVIAVIKLAGILERIADYAKNIAKRTLVLAQSSPIPAASSVLPLMAQVTNKMIKDSLDAFVEMDPELAESVWARDAQVDELNNSLFRELLTYMFEEPRMITPCTHLIFVAKNIERIGDHATNIAEMVYYAATGRQMEGKRPKADVTSETVVKAPGGSAE